MNFTTEQRKAIYEGGRNILVSAGAGSGKTAVLTERILQKLKRGIQIDSLIVLTFTNAAAFEMKERIREKIKQEIEKGADYLQEQLDKLDQAIIGTFDSFSLGIVQKYHYLLGIDKHIEIADASIFTYLKMKIIDDLFTSLYENNDLEFLEVVDTFCMKDDQKLRESIYQIAEKLRSMPSKIDTLENLPITMFKEDEIQKHIEEYLVLLSKDREKILEIIEQIEPLVTDPLEKWYTSLLDIISCYEKATTYDDYAHLCYKVPSMPRSKKIDEEEMDTIKGYYDQMKNTISHMVNLTTHKNEKEIIKELQSMKKTVSVICNILLMYEKNLIHLKKQYGIYEFDDITRFAIEIFEKHEEIVQQYKEKTTEIMIDEYQDTNDIGEYLISLLADNNLYMVGDVKQSIYGFRNANPALFMQKYKSYEHGEGIGINLIENFRSRREVLHGINFIFEKLMDITVGGADYTKGHEMIFGNQIYETKGKKEDTELEILDYHFESREFSKDEIEAFLIAYDIQNKIKQKTLVFDFKKGNLRPVEYSDFVILMDRKTSFDLYKKIFTYLEIPLLIHKDEEFINSDEIFVVRSILKLLLVLKDPSFYHSNFKHAFVSLARSFLFSYTDEQIFLLFKRAEDENITLLKSLQKDKTFIDLYERLDYIFKKIDLLTLTSLLEEIYTTFTFYEKINRLENVEVLVAKLEYLITLAGTLERLEYDLTSFVSYFDFMIQNKMDITFSLSKNKGCAVNMMTIHKSKGLEYPICYYSGLSKKFSQNDCKEKFTFSRELGMITPIFNEGIKETIYKTLLKERHIEKDVSEKIRLFYVALTRAKEKIIIVTNLSDSTKRSSTSIAPAEQRLTLRSFYDFLAIMKDTLSLWCKSVSLEDVPITSAYQKRKEKKNIECIKTSEKKLNIISFKIQDKKTIDHFSSSPLILNADVKKKMEEGTLFHEYLEFIDFKNRQESYKFYNIPLFYKEKIEALFKTSFMQNIECFDIYKEFEFIDEDKDNMHGIIDLLLEGEEQVIIIDYKLKEIEKETYKRQVGLYMDYIKRHTNKKVLGYIYSLLEERYITV